MARKRERAKHRNRKYGIQLNMTGAQKNEILDYCEKMDVSLNALILYAALTFVRSERGIPEPGPSQFSIATMDEVLAAYARGERVLMPCGMPSCDMKISKIAEMEFCSTCNIRVS